MRIVHLTCSKQRSDGINEGEIKYVSGSNGDSKAATLDGGMAKKYRAHVVRM